MSCHFTDFYNIKGQYLNAQTDCHIKRMEQEPCTYPMPILISLAFLIKEKTGKGPIFQLGPEKPSNL